MRDGHIHSPYCPHGSSDALKTYIEEAIRAGYHSMTFTEHAPLPQSFIDPVPSQDSGMAYNQVKHYLEDLEQLKEMYKNDIHILKGMEVDYIQGYEEETKQLLNRFGPLLDDSILSVHFLKGKKGWYCIDFSPEMYKDAFQDLGGLEQLYQTYYRTLEMSVVSDLGLYKPKRIGHMTLVRKFRHLYPSPYNWHSYGSQFLDTVKAYNYELDYNGAGMKKPHCQETYPPLPLARQASSMGIPLIYGSDAHQSSALMQGIDAVDQKILKR
ncbi:histidinol-phosphatase HisJ [Halobacillus litoralis]|uniref:histidinol-phosphatase HisJ n=1 Tax=Halobacillus litoralis TaxID=45668 RepID=UPI001CFC4DCA|nr:histidinol-phosphatase HisJ [Halobacillus litoralis]